MGSAERAALEAAKQLDPLEHVVKFEVHKYTPASVEDGVPAFVGTLVGFLSGMGMEASLYGDSSNSVGAPLARVSEALRPQALVSDAVAMPRALAATPLKRSVKHKTPETPVQQKATALVPAHESAPPVALQAGEVIGAIGLLAFGAAALSSAVRYRITKRRILFKSDLSEDGLRSQFALPSVRKNSWQ